MAQNKNNRSGNPARQHRPHNKTHSHKSKPVSWIAGARLRTLPVAIAPVLIGAGVAVRAHVFSWTLSGLALALALAIQIGVNYANDYSDGVRGTDANRVGPGRLVGSGSKSPRSVLTVALVFLGLAALAGLAITVITQIWWLLAVGAVALAAAWFYTGGKRPYGYAGLGEIAVFVFFGPVATMGTAFIQMKGFSFWALAFGAGVGLLTCSVLMINNIRDIETDKTAGKRTLAVRLGSRFSKVVFVAMLVVPMVGAGAVSLLFTDLIYVQFAWLILIPTAVIAIWGKTAAEYVLVLRLATMSTLVYGALAALMIAQPWRSLAA